MSEGDKHKGTLLWSVAAAILTFPLFLLFAHFGRPGSGRAAWIFALVIIVALKVRWELRGHVWFWSTMALIVAVHIPLILFVPWTNRWIPAFVILPIGIADAIAVLTLVQFVEKRMTPSGAAGELCGK